MPKKFCRHCGQQLPALVYKPKEYPKLAADVVRDIYTSQYRRSYLAATFNIPLRLVTKIKRAPSREEAVSAYGH
jgi:hypothetical protein